MSIVYVKPIKSQTTAGLWCFFAGGFGAHRFYLGRVVSAVCYLVFFWTGIPSVLSLIDMLVIAFTSPQRWAEQYNGGNLSLPVHWLIKVLALLPPLLLVWGLISLLSMDTSDLQIIYKQYSGSLPIHPI